MPKPLKELETESEDEKGPRMHRKPQHDLGYEGSLCRFPSHWVKLGTVLWNSCFLMGEARHCIVNNHCA